MKVCMGVYVGARPSLDSTLIPRPHSNPQSPHSVPYTHPPHDVQPQYPGTVTLCLK